LDLGKQAVGSLLHLHDAHERAQLLLPWYVNRTLEGPETALLEAHLAECAECRADLAAERLLSAELATMPEPEPAGLARRSSRTPKLRQPSRGRFLARRVPVGWVAGAAAAAAAVMAALLLMPPAAPEPAADGAYRLLGSEAGSAAGNAIVMFAPTATEPQLRAALEAAGARLVDGPTASGAYIVHLAPAERPAALERLRSADEVVLAEPIDGGAAP
jgi:hypothetical protein